MNLTYKHALDYMDEMYVYDYDNRHDGVVEAAKVELDLLCMNAIMKQIPKEVQTNGYGVYFCPICNGSVWQNKDESKFCFRCGNALKWEV